MWIGRRVFYAVEAHIWSYIFSGYLSVWGRVLLKNHKTKQRCRLIPKDDVRVSLSTTVPRMSDIVRRKQAQKYSITEWLAGWSCYHLSIREKLKWLAVHYFFLTFCPLTQWYAGSYETVFRISTTSANHFLKVFMLACKSILLKFHLTYWQWFVQALP